MSKLTEILAQCQNTIINHQQGTKYPALKVSEAEAAIVEWVESEMIGKDDDGWNWLPYGWSALPEDKRQETLLAAIRNDLRGEQRSKLHPPTTIGRRE